jgi:hypothetical protein
MKLYTTFVSFVTAALFVSSSVLLADSPIEAVIDDVVARKLEDNNLQAVSVGVIRDGARVTRHFGTMSTSNKSKPTDDTLYEVGSVTKVFTGLLLADAIVRGEVNSKTKLNTLLPASYQMEGKDIRQVAVSRPGASIKKTIRLPVADLKRCEGTFAATRGMVLRFEVQAGHLFVVPQGQGMDQLYPTSRNTFISKRSPVEVEFTFDEQRLATEIAVRQNGRTLNAKRVED